MPAHASFHRGAHVGGPFVPCAAKHLSLLGLLRALRLHRGDGRGPRAELVAEDALAAGHELAHVVLRGLVDLGERVPPVLQALDRAHDVRVALQLLPVGGELGPRRDGTADGGDDRD